jgi:O-antigen ligase
MHAVRGIQSREQPATDALGRDGIFAVLILLVASVSLGNWLPESSAAVLLLRVVWVLLYLAAVAVLTLRFGSAWVAWTLRHQPALCILLAVALASCLWSVAPPVSLRTAVSLVGTTALGVFIGYCCPPERIMRVLAWTFAILIVASALAMAFLPIPASRAIGWRGIMNHKNTFGAAAALAALFFLVITQRQGIRRAWWGAASSLLSFAALTQARSRTSLATFVVGIAALAYLSTVSAAELTLATLRRVSLALVLFVSVVPFVVGPLAAAFGNEDPLNGRTRLWSGVATILSERPLTGYGYEAVWKREKATLLPHIPVTSWPSATTAHNSILHIAGELGAPAAVLACFLLFSAFFDAGRLLKSAPSAFSVFSLLFVLSMTIIGLMEAHLLRVHSVFWILFVAVTVAVKRSLQRLDGATAPTQATS